MKIQKLSELRFYRELFRSEFDKHCLYVQKTYLSIQPTVSAQKLCIYISRIVFKEKNQFYARIHSFIQQHIVITQDPRTGFID